MQGNNSMNIRCTLCVLRYIADWCDGQCSMCHCSDHAPSLCCEAALQVLRLTVQFVWWQSTECQRVWILCWVNSLLVDLCKTCQCHLETCLGHRCSCCWRGHSIALISPRLCYIACWLLQLGFVLCTEECHGQVAACPKSVSYTHLTLPTNREV